jgi:hypothetical protein
MAIREKFEVRGRISQEAKGATERISKLLDRSQSNLLEQMILTWEALWLQHRRRSGPDISPGSLSSLMPLKSGFADIHQAASTG